MKQFQDGSVGAHDEVVDALREIGDPRLGMRIAADRGSELEYLGVRFPALRKRVKQGFSFYALQEDDVVAIWDTLWRTSRYGDVLFAALEYYGPIVKDQVIPTLWPTVRHWVSRVDNWCHSDGLSSLYSWILASYPDEVYSQLKAWNRTNDQWLRRISIVSLIHYSGKNAVFMPPDAVLPLVSTCIEDDRYYVQRAVGWVLREMGHAYPNEIIAYVEEHIKTMPAIAFSRAIERRSSEVKSELRAKRKKV